MTCATHRGWGPGYPVDRRRDMTKVTQGDVSVWVHREISPLVGWLMMETEHRGYDLRGGQCWGYCNRCIRGSTKASNHSWGLAVDLNAPSNPMANELRTDMPRWMPALWKEWGFAWGGDYRRRKDAMHYEFMGTPADARELVERLKQPPVPVRTEPGGIEPTFNPPLVLRPVIAAYTPPEGGVVLVADNGDTYAFAGANYPGPLPGHAPQGDPGVLEPVVDELRCPSGGVWLLADSGAIYAFAGAPYLGGANGKDYFGGRRAARLLASEDPGVPADWRIPDAYVIQATSGELYGPRF